MLVGGSEMWHVGRPCRTPVFFSESSLTTSLRCGLALIPSPHELTVKPLFVNLHLHKPHEFSPAVFHPENIN